MNPPFEPSPGSPSPALLEILGKLAGGQTNVQQAAEWVTALSSPAAGTTTGGDQMATVSGATVDIGRQERCGFGEVVYGEGKSTELIGEIAKTHLAAGQNCFITRISPTASAQLRHNFPKTHHNPVARTLRIDLPESPAIIPPPLDLDAPDGPAHVAVVTAGSTDAAVAEEAIETLTWMGISHDRVDDVGVAGPQRLLTAVPRIRKAAAIVVIAGMEGALPPTVAGHVAVPVIAVPTSNGYGANFAGLTPLMGMLTSCAANVAVVNIDAGFKGGYLAGLIAAGLNAKV